MANPGPMRKLVFARPSDDHRPPGKMVLVCVRTITANRWGRFKLSFLGFAWICESDIEKRSKTLATFAAPALAGYKNGHVLVKDVTWYVRQGKHSLEKTTRLIVDPCEQ